MAGTGARSGGQARRGVAFGASLVNGKVLDDSGFGSDSGIIAGMEWAAAQRAQAEVAQLAEHGIGLIDIVVVNVKRFCAAGRLALGAARRGDRDDRRRRYGPAHGRGATTPRSRPCRTRATTRA